MVKLPSIGEMSDVRLTDEQREALRRAVSGLALHLPAPQGQAVARLALASDDRGRQLTQLQQERALFVMAIQLMRDVLLGVREQSLMPNFDVLNHPTVKAAIAAAASTKEGE